jgi:hypothetical protein
MIDTLSMIDVRKVAARLNQFSLEEIMKTEFEVGPYGDVYGVMGKEWGNKNFNAEDGRSYCTRCFVWRPQRGAHHCRTCQRCVVDFGAHC